MEQRNQIEFEEMKGELNVVYRKMLDKLSQILGFNEAEYLSAEKYLEDTSFHELVKKYPNIYPCLPGLPFHRDDIPVLDKLLDISRKFIDELREAQVIIDSRHTDVHELLTFNLTKELRFATLVASKVDSSAVALYRDDFLANLYFQLLSAGKEIPPQLKILIPVATREKFQAEVRKDVEACRKMAAEISQKIREELRSRGVPLQMAKSFIGRGNQINNFIDLAEEGVNSQIAELLREYGDPRLFFDRIVA